MERKRINIKEIEMNTGQIAGVPANPREWTKSDLDKLVKSIEETPELLEARGIIVYPSAGKYIVMGGNMRLTACKKMKMQDVPCIVLPEDTSAEKLREIVIKDNGSFGGWDFDMLANEWDDLPLTDFGVPAWNTEEASGGNPKAKEDDFNEESETIICRCKRGEIWKCGNHRVMCGDSSSADDVKELLGGV